MAIQISGTTVIDNSRNLSNIANASTSGQVNSYVIRNSNGEISSANFVECFSSTTPLGRELPNQGGYLICKSASIAWIVSPNKNYVSWYNRAYALNEVDLSTGCSGWFIPTCAQLQNPGYTCRTYWFSPSPADPSLYWSDTTGPLSRPYVVDVSNNTATPCVICCFHNVRAFRCVTY